MGGVREVNHHVGNIDFGRGITPYSSETPLREIYMTAQVEDDLSRQLLLMETYDQTYDIYDHERSNKLMAVLAMHPAEDAISGSRLKTVARELVALRLPEITNTPLVEMMNYPRWLLDDLIADARKAKVQETTTTKQFEQQLGIDHR